MSALRASSRPVPVRRRSDLLTHLVPYGGLNYHVVEDPVSMQYTRLREDQFELLMRLDGVQSLQGLLSQMKSRFPQLTWTLSGLQQAIADFHRKGLVVADRCGQSSILKQRRSEERRKKLGAALLQPLSIQFPGIGTTPWLDYCCWLTGWMLHPWSLFVLTVICLWAWTLLLLNLRDFEAGLPAFQQFFGWRNLSAMWLTLAVAKMCHEFGHAIVCRHFGAKCHEVGLMLLMLSPCLYCDVSDSWTLRSKWQRIAIAAAGMGVEFLLSSLAILVWYFTTEGWWHHLALNLFFVTAVTTVIFNANPLMKLDGYYILSDLLEIPNLRGRADKRFNEWCEAIFLGRELPRTSTDPEPPRWWFPLFSLACLIYLIFVMVGSLWFISLILHPQQLDSLGLALATLMASLIVGRSSYRIGKSILAKDKKPVQRVHLVSTLAVGLILVLIILSIPVPGWGQAPCIVESREIREIRTVVPGRLSQVRVQPGSRVTAGDVLMVLENPEIEQKGVLLRSQIETERARYQAAIAREEGSFKALSEATLTGLYQQLAEQEFAESRLTIRAPQSGIIIDAPPVTGEPESQRRRQLTAWSGSPLDRENEGAFLEPGSFVCAIAPTPDKVAIAYLDQTQREDCRVGECLSIRFGAHPWQRLEATVESLSAEEVNMIPPSLSVKAGGSLPTVSTSSGVEQVDQVLYQARLKLADQTLPISDGMQGEVSIPLKSRPLGSWAIRWLARTFRFEWF
ncbi:site-2 protease family protein [Planctopirus hydrillae]|uniref:Uncharacterized protein n=1 Tax=Planctopirus hydrillae TaxID=1841610 RepID=A0A1C3E7H5_9PLAN|nr:site-2 protease family protein [Planctopirus hydrillae]ODA29186.1 hypothetical protein A6X21_09640 [Planctopirus hydrillae]